MYTAPQDNSKAAKMLAEHGDTPAAVARLMRPVEQAAKQGQRPSASWADKATLDQLYTYCTSLGSQWALQQVGWGQYTCLAVSSVKNSLQFSSVKTRGTAGPVALCNGGTVKRELCLLAMRESSGGLKGFGKTAGSSHGFTGSVVSAGACISSLFISMMKPLRSLTKFALPCSQAHTVHITFRRLLPCSQMSKVHMTLRRWCMPLEPAHDLDGTFEKSCLPAVKCKQHTSHEEGNERLRTGVYVQCTPQT